MVGSIPFAIKRNETTAFTRGLLDDVDAAAARATLDLGNAASLDVGTTAGTVAAGDDSRFGGGSGDALVANPLSQFAATTSAQLAGVISDETGTGALVFANTPTLISPAIGAATGTSLVLSGNLTGAAATFSGTLLSSFVATASTSVIQTTGTLLTGGTGTTNFPQYLAQPTAATAATTWSTAGTFFGVNSASGFTGNFLDFRLNGAASVCSVSRLGEAIFSGFVDVGATLFVNGPNGIRITNRCYLISPSTNLLEVRNSIGAALADLAAANGAFSGLLKFTGYTTALLPTASAHEGAITYDTTLDKHVGSNGTIWNVLW